MSKRQCLHEDPGLDPHADTGAMTLSADWWKIGDEGSKRKRRYSNVLSNQRSVSKHWYISDWLRSAKKAA